MSGRGRDGLVGVAQGGLSESAAGSVFEAEDDYDLWRGRGALADGHGRSLIAPFGLGMQSKTEGEGQKMNVPIPRSDPGEARSDPGEASPRVLSVSEYDLEFRIE